MRGSAEAPERTASRSDQAPAHTTARRARSSPPAWRTTTGSRQARGYDAAWLRLSAAVVAEHPVCQVCGAEPSTQADHIIPLSADPPGARLDRRNIQAIGDRCHRAKIARESHDARRRNHVRQ